MPTDADAARQSRIPPGVGLRSPALSPQVLFASPNADKSGKGEEIPTVQGFPLGKDLWAKKNSKLACWTETTVNF